MCYVYVLQSKKDNLLYVGYTRNLRSRLELHMQGKIESTKNRIQVKLYEASLNQ